MSKISFYPVDDETARLQQDAAKAEYLRRALEDFDLVRTAQIAEQERLYKEQINLSTPQTQEKIDNIFNEFKIAVTGISGSDYFNLNRAETAFLIKIRDNRPLFLTTKDYSKGVDNFEFLLYQYITKIIPLIE